MIFYYKNQFINSDKIEINQNLFNGIGIFETIKFTNNKLLFFGEHMNRLLSNNFFDFTKIKKEKIYDDAIKVINQNSIVEGLVKIIILPTENNWNDLEYYIFIRELPKINTPIVKVVFYKESLYPILRFNPMYKSLSYMGNFMAKRDAKLEGAFEPIFYNQDNIITEGAIRNIFFVKENIIYTPSTKLGILNGITRQKIIKLAQSENYEVETLPINFDSIHSMDEAFITSSAIGVLPCKWDNWNSDFTITYKLKNLYHDMSENQ
jgi:branched-subunit amino acid aminotransferase/4-amino-4-deoxychorismate lyase